MIDATTLDIEPPAAKWTRIVDQCLAENRARRAARERGRHTLRALMDCTLRVSGVRFDDFLADNRHQAVLSAKRAFVLAARTYTQFSYPEIAAALGMGTHATIYHRHLKAQTDQQARDIAEQAAQLMGWTTQ